MHLFFCRTKEYKFDMQQSLDIEKIIIVDVVSLKLDSVVYQVYSNNIYDKPIERLKITINFTGLIQHRFNFR